MIIGTKSYSDEFYIVEIQKNNKKIIEQFYVHCKGYFSGSYRKLFAQKDMEEDFFQESFIKLWKEICHQSIYVNDNQIYKVDKMGDAKPLMCNLRTYLIDIAKKDYSRYLKKKEVFLDDIESFSEDSVVVDMSGYENDQKMKIVLECVEKLPASCYRVISLFYYEKRSYDEIMNLSDTYTSKDALKTRKYKCMEQLQKRIEEQFNKYNLKPYKHETRDVR